MKQLLAKLRLYGPKKFLYFIFGESNNILKRILLGSYSQNREDLIIHKLLSNKNKGFYIDIGAYDPNRFSNTKYFYNKGWSGINIEPNTGNYKRFLKSRRHDVNLNVGIGSITGKTTFYEFFPDTLSTFSTKEVMHYQKIGFQLINKRKVSILRLDNVIEKYCANKRIDFLSIDTEGFEMEVLKSNNWKRFKPTLICIESYTFQADFAPSRERVDIKNYLLSKGYEITYINSTNIIYRVSDNSNR